MPTGSGRATRYSEEERQRFLHRATEIGVAAAMRELGYPSRQQAHDWTERYGVDVPKSDLHAKARAAGIAYAASEQMYVACQILDASHEMLELGVPVATLPEGSTEPVISRIPLDPSGLSRVSMAVQRAVQVMELVEGRATERSEHVTVDATDLEIRSLVADMRERNEHVLEQLRAPAPAPDADETPATTDEDESEQQEHEHA